MKLSERVIDYLYSNTEHGKYYKLLKNSEENLAIPPSKSEYERSNKAREIYLEHTTFLKKEKVDKKLVF